MNIPANAKLAKIDYLFIYEKNGEKKEFDKKALPDSTWTFVDRKEIILEPGENNEPPIKDFYFFTQSGTDTTEAIMEKPGNYYLLFIKDIEKETPWIEEIQKTVAASKEKSIPFYVIASQVSAAEDLFNTKNKIGVPVLSCDVTAIKTAARTNPTLYLINGPVVVKKWGKSGFGAARP